MYLAPSATIAKFACISVDERRKADSGAKDSIGAVEEEAPGLPGDWYDEASGIAARFAPTNLEDDGIAKLPDDGPAIVRECCS